MVHFGSVTQEQEHLSIQIKLCPPPPEKLPNFDGLQPILSFELVNFIFRCYRSFRSLFPCNNQSVNTTK